MVSLTETEAKLARMLLRLAAAEFSNHGCNDFDVRDAGLSLEESNQLWKKLAEWDDPELAKREGAIHYDWMLMRYLAYKLR